MYESRCGICCNDCERKEEVNCKGCLNMEKTFWGGECEVKSCAEGRGVSHCGVCDEFPCELTANMGKDMGFDPEPRLQKCREWAEES